MADNRISKAEWDEAPTSGYDLLTAQRPSTFVTEEELARREKARKLREAEIEKRRKALIEQAETQAGSKGEDPASVEGRQRHKEAMRKGPQFQKQSPAAKTVTIDGEEMPLDAAISKIPEEIDFENEIQSSPIMQRALRRRRTEDLVAEGKSQAEADAIAIKEQEGRQAAFKLGQETIRNSPSYSDKETRALGSGFTNSAVAMGARLLGYEQAANEAEATSAGLQSEMSRVREEQHPYPKIQGALAGAASNAIQMLPGMVSAPITGPTVGMAVMAGQYGSQEYSRAQYEGAEAGLSGAELDRYALIQGGIEASIMPIFSKIPGLGGLEGRVLRGNIASSVASHPSVRKVIASGAMKFTKDTAAELAEEVTTEVLHGWATQGLLNEEVDYKGIIKDTVLQTLVMMGASEAAQQVGGRVGRERPPEPPLIDSTREPVLPGEQEQKPTAEPPAPTIPPAVEAFTQNPSRKNYEAAVNAGLEPRADKQTPDGAEFLSEKGRKKYAAEKKAELAAQPKEVTPVTTSGDRPGIVRESPAHVQEVQPANNPEPVPDNDIADLLNQFETLFQKGGDPNATQNEASAQNAEDVQQGRQEGLLNEPEATPVATGGPEPDQSQPPIEAGPVSKPESDSTSAQEPTEPRRGVVGDMLATGEVVQTSSGRSTTPFPKIDVTSDRKAGNTVKRVDEWLHSNALAEAEARGDEWNAMQFRNEKPGKMPPATKDLMEEYLFGEQPKVVPSILKPLVSQPEPSSPQLTVTPTNSQQLTEQAKPPVPAFSALHKKSQDLFNKAFESKDIDSLKQMVAKNNVAWNTEFQNRTGLKLPKTVKGRNQVVLDWAKPAEVEPVVETPAKTEVQPEKSAIEYPETGPVIEDWFGADKARVLEWTKTLTPGKLKRKDYAAVYRDGKRIAAGLVEMASGNMIDILSDGKIQRFFQGDKGSKFAVGIPRQRDAETKTPPVETQESKAKAEEPAAKAPAKPAFESGKPMTRDTVFPDAPKPEKTLSGQQILPGMTGRAEEIDRSEFVRKHQTVLLDDMRELVDDEDMLDALREPVGNILEAVWNNWALKAHQDLYDTDLGNDLWTALTAKIAYHAPAKREAGLESIADEVIRRAFTHRDSIKPKVAEKSAEPTESDFKAGVRAEIARQLAEEAAAAAAKPPASTKPAKPPSDKPKAPRKPRTKTGEKLGKLSEDTGTEAKQAFETWLKGVKGMPLNSALGPFNPEMAKMTVTMVRAQVKDKVVKFADLVARVVEWSSPAMARNLSDYIEAAWDILRETDSRLDETGKVADVLGPEKEVTDDEQPAGDGRREAAGRPLGETPVEETPPEDVSTADGGGDSGRSGSTGGGRPEPETSGTVRDGDEGTGGVPTSPAGDDRPAGRRERIDYRITGEDQIGEKFNPRERFDKNVDAIKVLKQIESENRRATPEEQKVLAQYVGWGGLKEAFSTRDDQGLREKAILKDLLTEQELAQARMSVRNAHYTSPEVISAMWEGLTDAGFSGGRILEPSMGIGHFYGLVPDAVAAVSKLSGIEMDSLTARIAQQLYQTADIQHSPYERVNVKNPQDLVISNVPFGQYKASDKYDKSLKHKESIHNFFFLKALKNVRPGGVVAFITSRYTMDSVDPAVREKISAAGGRFVGAVRLPNNAFMGIAKTKVTTDVIFIQKEAGDAQPWRNTKETADGFVVNEYFHDNPENVLGKIDPKGGTQMDEWGVAPDGHDIGKELAQKIAAMPFDKSALAENSTEDAETAEDTAEDADVPDGRLAIKENKLFKAVGGKLEEVPLWGGERGQDRKFAVIRDMGSLAAVRDRLSDLETSSLATDAEIERARKRLNTDYDKFVKEHGFVHKNENRGLFREDEQLPTLLALEEWDSDTKTAKKAEVFEKRVQRPADSATTPSTAEGAAVESYARLGRIDLPMISEWLGKSESQVEQELTGWAYKDPATGEWSLKNVYLSGNIANKLKDAEKAAKDNPAFQKNVEDLKRVLPPRKKAGDIHVRPRSPFITADQYQQFMRHLGVNGIVRHDDVTGSWQIDNPHIEDAVKAGPWGVGRKTAADLIEGLLNNKPPVVWGKDENGNRVVNHAATQLARAKSKEIEDEFGKWVFADPDRAKAIEDSFNDGIGAYVEGEWDGGHLTLPGMNVNITLLPHQLNAIWRAIVSGNTLLAHEVGLGKTFIMAAIAMERKRLGLATNQMFVVPNHLLSQWASEFKALYPSAKLLALESDQINSKNRRTLMERVKSGRFDAIIVTPEAYKKMPMSNDIVREALNAITKKIENTIKEAKKAKGENKNFVAKLESVLDSIRGKMEVMLNDPAKDAGAKFDELGIDAIYVDEAHEYRNLWSMTQMGDISGVGLEGNQKTFDMLLKTDYLNQKTNNRGIVFATGTPIANSISELYSMQRYLQPHMLAEAGVASFDDWANTFGEAVTDIEVDPTGSGFRSKTRFKEFRNTIALSKLFRQVADVKYAEDVGLDKVRPKLRGGKLHAIQVMPSLGLLGYVRNLVQRLEISKARSFDKRIDNPLKVTTDGRKAALDMRLVVPEEDGISSKINIAVENVARIYREEDERKGVQLLWVNLGTPASTKKTKKKGPVVVDPDADSPDAKMNNEEDDLESGRINAYEDIKQKLIAQGIPEDEIAFIHDYQDKDKKRALFQKARDGKVRIIISTVKKLATGANIQTRLAAMHFYDPPWKPADIEQAVGRAIRRGNLYKDWGGVQAFTYVTRGSFDAYIWQLLENKAKAIKQIMRGESDSVEDTGRIELNADEVKALASSNPKVLELVKVRNDVGQLRAEYYGYRQEQANIQSDIGWQRSGLEYAEKHLKRIDAELKKMPSRDDLHSDFKVTIGKKEYSKRSEIGAALIEAMPVIDSKDKAKRAEQIKELAQNPVKIGSVLGIPLFASRSSFDDEKARIIIGENGDWFEPSDDNTGNGVKLFNYFDKKYDEPSRQKAEIAKDQSVLTSLEQRAGVPWPKEEKLTAGDERLRSLEAELGSAAGQKGSLPVVSALTKYAIMAEKLGRQEGRPVTFDGTQWLHGDRKPVRQEAVTTEMEREVDNEVQLLLVDSKESPQKSFFFHETKEAKAKKEAAEAKEAIFIQKQKNARYYQDFRDEWARITSGSTPGMGAAITPELLRAAGNIVVGEIRVGAKRFSALIKNLRAEFDDAIVLHLKPTLIAMWNANQAKYGLDDATPELFDDAMSDTVDVDVEKAVEAAKAATEPIEPSGDKLFSTKNAFTDAARTELDMPERPPVATQGREPSIDLAKEIGETKAGSDLIDTLIRELAVSPRTVTPQENDLLNFRNAELSNKLDDALRVQIAARKSGNDAQESVQATAVADLRVKRRELIEILETIGTAAGRALQARKAVINQDYTLERLALEFEAAHGREPNPKELEAMQADIDDLNAKIAELEKLLAAADAKNDDLQDRLKDAHSEAVEKVTKKTAKTPPVEKEGNPRLKAAREKIDNAYKRLKSMLGEGTAFSVGGALGEAGSVFVDLATGYSELGVITLKEFLNRVGKRMGPAAKELIPQLTAAWRQVRGAADQADISSVTDKIDPMDPDTIGRAARNLHAFVIERDALDASPEGREAAVAAVHSILVDFIPGLTIDDTARAMSGIGIYSELSDNEIEVIRRDQKAQLLSLQQIMDWKRGTPPPATGQERPPVSDEQRLLRKLVNEAKKASGLSTTTAGQLRSALDAAKRMATNRISDLTKAIESGQRISKSQKLLQPDAELETLRSQRDALQKLYDETFGKPELSDEQRLNAAEKALDRAIADLESDLKVGKLYPDAQKARMTSPAIEAKRAALDALKASRDELRLQSGEAQERSDAAYERHLLERSAELARRLAEGDFKPKPKKPERVLTPAMLKLQLGIAQDKQKLDKQRKAWEFQNRHPVYRAWKQGPVAGAHIIRKALTMWDQSLIGRQGFLLGITNRKIYGKAIRKAFASNPWTAKSIFPTEQDLFNTQAALDADANGVRLEKIGKLAVTDVHGGINREEGSQFVPEWFDKLWGVGASERAGSAFINTLRRLVFRSLVEKLATKHYDGNVSSISNAELRVIGNMVNVASGRGSLGKWANSLEALTMVFFSPRWWASRLQWWSGQPVWHDSRWLGGEGASWEVRQMAAQEWAKQAAAQAAIMAIVIAGLTAAFGDPGEDEEWDWYGDPRSPDFGKIRLGSTPVDMTAGLGQHLSLFARLFSGKQVDRWETKDVDALGLIGRHERGKLAPVPSAIVDYFAKKSISGEEFGSRKWLLDHVTPLIAQDVQKSTEREGIPLGPVLAAMMFFGIGAQSRDARVKERADIANELRTMKKQNKPPEKIQETLNKHLEHSAAEEAKDKLRTADPEDQAGLQKVIDGEASPELTAAIEKEKFDIVLNASSRISTDQRRISNDEKKEFTGSDDRGRIVARDLVQAMIPTEDEAIKLYDAAYKAQNKTLYEWKVINGERQRVVKSAVAAGRARIKSLYQK